MASLPAIAPETQACSGRARAVPARAGDAAAPAAQAVFNSPRDAQRQKLDSAGRRGTGPSVGATKIDDGWTVIARVATRRAFGPSMIQLPQSQTALSAFAQVGLSARHAHRAPHHASSSHGVVPTPCCAPLSSLRVMLPSLHPKRGQFVPAPLAHVMRVHDTHGPLVHLKHEQVFRRSSDLHAHEQQLRLPNPASKHGRQEQCNG